MSKPEATAGERSADHSELGSEELTAILQTEEFVLQGARASTISESSARATIYLSSVSSGLIAIALTAQISRIGDAFYVLGLCVLPTLAFLGLVSYLRVMQTGIDDLASAAAIARIREHYASLDPRYSSILPFSIDDRRPHMSLAVSHSSRWQLLFTAASMISIVTSILAGATVGLALSAAGIRLAVATIASVPVGGGAFAVFLVDQRSRWIRGIRSLPPV